MSDKNKSVASRFKQVFKDAVALPTRVVEVGQRLNEKRKATNAKIKELN